MFLWRALKSKTNKAARAPRLLLEAMEVVALLGFLVWNQKSSKAVFSEKLAKDAGLLGHLLLNGSQSLNLVLRALLRQLVHREGALGLGWLSRFTADASTAHGALRNDGLEVGKVVSRHRKKRFLSDATDATAAVFIPEPPAFLKMNARILRTRYNRARKVSVLF